MSGIEQIKQKILSDAELYAKDLIEAAEEKAEKIRETARMEAEKKRNDIMEEAEREAADTGKRMIAFADMEMKKENLKVKRQIVERAFEKAMKELCNMPKHEYCKLLGHMIARAAGQEKAEIILAAKDRDCLGEELMESVYREVRRLEKQIDVGLAGCTYDIQGGFVLKEGGVEMNYSFEALLRAHREELEEIAYSMLNIR